MKRFIAVLLVDVFAVLFAAQASAQTAVPGQMSLAEAATTLNTHTAIPSTAFAETITTFALPIAARAVHFYVDFDTTGGMSSVTWRPAALIPGGAVASTAATGYYTNRGSNEILTMTTAGKGHLRVPREAFGAYQYGGLGVTGTGTYGTAYFNAYYKVEY